MRWIVITKKTGQVGNRLTVFAHTLVAARARGWGLLNPSFNEYAPNFVGPRSNVAGCVAAHPSHKPGAMARRLAYALARVAWETGKVLRPLSLGLIARARARNEEHLELGAVIDAAAARGGRLLLLQGYHFRLRDEAAFLAHGDEVRRFLAPLPEHETAGAAAVAALRGAGDLVVGIHIRQGDYAQHLGGRFFWSPAVYAGLMSRLAEVLAPRRPAFLICTNGRFTAANFPGLTVGFGPGAATADLAALMRCDLLLAPPSSFSAWAAWWGRVPIHKVQDPAAPFTLEDFRVDVAPDPLY